eukprot:5808623-Lingulodinium_polyedra.AAC.1
MVARLPEMPLQLCCSGPGRLVEGAGSRCPGVGDSMIPCPQGGERPDAVDAVLHRQDEPIGDRPRDCRGASRRDAYQESFLVRSGVLIERHG